jgi:hypothetical protein
MYAPQISNFRYSIVLLCSNNTVKSCFVSFFDINGNLKPDRLLVNSCSASGIVFKITARNEIFEPCNAQILKEKVM